MITVKSNGNKSWVTFTVTPDENISEVAVSGEWSEWAEEPMKQKKNGDFSITKILKNGETFQFGYKVNGSEWMTESECSTVPSPYFSENSLLEL
jgi:hypothetical protein